MGCQFAPRKASSLWPWSKAEPKHLPDRLVPVWTDSILHQPNQPGIRGFGGRVYFYAEGNTDPIEVDGNFAVYVFDADDLTPVQQKPLRKYVFTADQFATHMSKTSIGPSYSVWLPWGEVGGPPQRLSLIGRFEGREGGTTISDPTIKLLPGVPTHQEKSEARPGKMSDGNGQVQLAGHADNFQSATQADEKKEKKDIETIDLPPDFQRHLKVTPKINGLPAESRAPTEPFIGKATAQGNQNQTNRLGIETSIGQQDEPVGPVQTHVVDYRTKNRQRANKMFSTHASKTDIREGSWIKSPSEGAAR